MRQEATLWLQSQETCCIGTWERRRWCTRRSRSTSSRSSSTRASRAAWSSVRRGAKGTSPDSVCRGLCLRNKQLTNLSIKVCTRGNQTVGVRVSFRYIHQGGTRIENQTKHFLGRDDFRRTPIGLLRCRQTETQPLHPQVTSLSSRHLSQ